MDPDQRFNTRLPRACTVSVEIVSIGHDGSGSAEHVDCATRDLSRTGVSLRLPRELSPGAVHHLTIAYFDDEPPLQLTGEVRWCLPAGGEPGRNRRGFCRADESLRDAIGHDQQQFYELDRFAA